MTEHYYAVIMAGGGGTRLWPLSRLQRPKQMLQLGGDRTLFQLAVDRLKELFPPSHIYVVTIANQAAKLQLECPEIPTENFLIEPKPRGTASVVGLAGLALYKRDPEAVMAVLTADHFIKNEDYFRWLLKNAYTVAQSGFLGTLGVQPTYPATGYGYIQRGKRLDEFAGLPVYRVERFREKPDQAAADTMIQRGDHYWNSGMFFWQAARILEEIKCHMPDLWQKLAVIEAAWEQDDFEAVIQATWPEIHPETIDYGIMEKASQVAVLPATDLGWDDVGSWDSLFDVLPADENGNIILKADYLGLNTSDTLVQSDGTGRLIVTIGVNNLILVDTNDALLVCSREQAQQVKQIVEQLKKNNRVEYL
jgi:mannose-1-phosphate guanylyltransferase